MALNLIHCGILGLGDNASLEEVKTAYRRLVKANHPDLFPPDEKLVQELKMMRINEAYRELVRAFEDSSKNTGTTPPAMSPDGDERPRVDGWDYDLHHRDPVLSSERGVGMHGDPSYAYYKQGFIRYSRGLGGIMDQNRFIKLTADANGLRRSLYALRNFQEAYDYFNRVVTDYPESIWARDARMKIERIRGYNRIYLKIQKNLKERLSGTPDVQPSGTSETDPTS
ncbi:MAG: J domain-containing protein [Spirochaetia bacterium]|nr:J domain-containing protein [Spirochaetia bacterium]